MKYYDNTRLVAYRECPRKFYFRHVRHWRREGLAIELAFGLAWHSAQDAIWHSIPAGVADPVVLEMAEENWILTMEEFSIPIDDPTFALEQMRNRGTFREMAHAYLIERRPMLERIELVQPPETPFAVPLPEPYLGKYYVGRLDKEFRFQNRIHIAEHKTTSWYKKDGFFRPEYIASFSPNSQIDGYIFAGYMKYGPAFKSVWVDMALVHKSVHNGFRFLPIEKLHSQIDLWMFDTTCTVQDIESDFIRLTNFRSTLKEDTCMYAFPRKTGSCVLYRVCQYHDVCRFQSNPELIEETPEGFVEEKWEPFNELSLSQLSLGGEDDE